MHRFAFLATAGFLALSAVPASATITITADQQTDQGEIILLPVDQSGTTVQGNTQDGFVLLFTSGTDTLLTPSNGQARIEAEDGLLNDITISTADGSLFDFIEFNAFVASGMLTINGFDQYGLAATFIFGDDAGENLNGENFIFAGTDALQAISSITISSAEGFNDLRQIRVGPEVTLAAVPEPATWAMMLFGFGAIGYSMRRRRNSVLAQIA